MAADRAPALEAVATTSNVPPLAPPPAKPRTPSRPSPDLTAFLLDLSLPACVFSHADLETHDDLQPPTLVNPALQALLEPALQPPSASRPGGGERRKSGSGEAARALLDVLDGCAQRKLREWLAEGVTHPPGSPVSPSSPSPTSSARDLPVPLTTPASPSSSPSASLPEPRPTLRRNTSSNRHIALQFSPHVSFSKLRWRATVCPSEGFTILTLLPSSEVALGGGVDPSELTEREPAPSAAEGAASDVSWTKKDGPLDSQTTHLTVRDAQARLGVPTECERVGEHEISLDGARDALTLEGLAFTAWYAPVGQFRVNRDCSIVQANPKWRHTAGIAEGESNDSWPARIHPDDRELVLAHYERIRQTLPCERDEFEFRWLPDEEGRDRWGVCVLEPAVIGGVVEGYCGFLINVSKHKEIITATQAQAAQLRSELAVLSEYCSVGLSRHAIDGTFLTVNQAWWTITRLDPALPLEAWQDQVHPDDRERVLAALANALSTLEPLTMQFRWKHGTVSLVQISPNQQDKEKATGWIGSVTDVTAQARAEEAMLNLAKEREARAKAEAEVAEELRRVAVEEKKQQELLIDVTSHEIRNPISAILQNADFTRSSLQSLRGRFAQLKARDALPSELDDKLLHDLDEDIEALDAITECGMAQERIANDILGLAQIQLSKYSITPVEFDLATSLRNICRMFKTECRAKGIQLQLVVGSSLARLGPRARVFADPARLTQVLVNLLSNAIRFTAKSNKRIVTLTVEVSAKPPGRDSPLIPPAETEYKIDKQKPVYLFFSVEDTGPGMTEEETSRLFAKFMQASPFTHTAWGGSGLGLWIARSLCELQGGRIEVSSTVGQGSTFRCFITAHSVSAGPDGYFQSMPVVVGITGLGVDRSQSPRARVELAGERRAPLQGLTILCCEDNLINRTVLRKQLVNEGCEDILLACDGQEGLDLLRQQPGGRVDCVLMDVQMPVLDGLAATRIIRQAEQREGLTFRQRIVGLTGNARNAQKQAALASGMDAVVTKPYRVADLVDKILASSTAPSSPALVWSDGPASAPLSSAPSTDRSFTLGAADQEEGGDGAVKEEASGAVRPVEGEVEAPHGPSSVSAFA